MGITTTLSKLYDKFYEWHINKYAELHESTENKINNINRDISSDITNVNNKIVKVAEKLILRTNGTSPEVNIDNISDVLNDNISNNINLVQLNDNINANTREINNIKNYAIDETYVAEEISSAMSDVGSNHYHYSIRTKDIKSGDNLNEYKETGIYRCTDGSTTQNITNIPSGMTLAPFFMTVFSAYNSTGVDASIVVQTIYLAYGDVGEKKIYTRNWYNNGHEWSNWSELYGTHNTSVHEMTVNFADNPTPQTLKILTKL
jgi:hypothetical protein